MPVFIGHWSFQIRLAHGQTARGFIPELQNSARSSPSERVSFFGANRRQPVLFCSLRA
jgi:hypothetical protein